MSKLRKEEGAEGAEEGARGKGGGVDRWVRGVRWLGGRGRGEGIGGE